MPSLYKSIYVLGASGQLGQCLHKRWKNQKDVFFLDRQQLDISDRELVKKKLQSIESSIVLNAAAFTAVDLAEERVEECFAVNRDGVENLAEAGKAFGHRIIHISTDYVFDGKKTEPYNENDSVCPINVYGHSKAEGEQALLRISPESLILRTSWLYSDIGKNFYTTMKRLGREKNEISVVNDQWGSPTFARDFACALSEIVQQIKKGSKNFGVYHFSNQSKTTWQGFAEAIMRCNNYDCRVNPISTEQYPTQAKRPRSSVLATEKIQRDFNLKIKSWEDALARCVET